MLPPYSQLHSCSPAAAHTQSARQAQQRVGKQQQAFIGHGFCACAPVAPAAALPALLPFNLLPAGACACHFSSLLQNVKKMSDSSSCKSKDGLTTVGSGSHGNQWDDDGELPHQQQDPTTSTTMIEDRAQIRVKLRALAGQIGPNILRKNFDLQLLDDSRSRYVGEGSFGTVRQLLPVTTMSVFKFAIIEVDDLLEPPSHISPTENILREIRKLAGFNHPHIVKIESYFCPDHDCESQPIHRLFYGKSRSRIARRRS